MTDEIKIEETIKPPREKHPIGPTIGIMIILVILLIGGLYYLSVKIEQRQSPTVNQNAGNN